MPASSNPSHIQQRRFARSKIPQTDYQTPTTVTVGANIIEFPVKDRNLAKHTVNAEDNKGDANGHNWPTEDYPTTHDVERSFDIRVSFEDIGRDLLDAFGAVAVTQPDSVNAPAVKKHKFTPIDISVSKQLPARTLVEIVGSGLNRLLPSLVCESFGLKGEGSTHVSASKATRGSGKVTTPSGIAATDVDAVRLTGQHYVTNTMVKLSISDAGTLANGLDYGAANRLDNWSFDVKNNLLNDQGYVPGDGLYQTAGDSSTGIIRSELLVESQDFEISLYARFASQSDQLAALRTRKAIDIIILLTGGIIGATTLKYSLKIEAVKARYEMVELGEKDGVVHVQLKPKLFLDQATGSITSVELVNDVASYTT
jgi:hypothetical protein